MFKHPDFELNLKMKNKVLFSEERKKRVSNLND